MSATTPVRMAAWLESAWLARYLERQLNDDEATWFEAYVLDKPELLATVETDTRLRDALAADPAAWRLGTASASEKGSESSRLHAGLPRWVAMASMLAIGLGIGWMGQRVLLTSFGNDASVASLVPVRYDVSRGAQTQKLIEPANAVNLDAGQSKTQIVIEVGVPADAQDVELAIGGKVVLGFLPPNDLYASFFVPREMIDRCDNATISFQSERKSFHYTLALPASQGRRKK